MFGDIARGLPKSRALADGDEIYLLTKGVVEESPAIYV